MYANTPTRFSYIKYVGCHFRPRNKPTLSSKMHNSKISSGNVKTFAVISFWVVHEGLTLEKILLIYMLHNFIDLITLKGLLCLCEQKCYFSLTEKGPRVMLNCEPTGQVHVLSHPVSHDLVQSSPSLQVSVALLVLL